MSLEEVVARRVWGFGGVLLFIITISEALGATPHYVFAHYMVAFATYGETAEGYKREIQEAQGAGIDGFVLNVGAWDNVQTYYKTRVGLIYDAAAQLGTGFKLFFSVDYTGTTNIVDMVRTYANRTNSFRYQGKVVLSSFGENDTPSTGFAGVNWTNLVIPQLASNGVSVYFVPHFWPDPIHELPTYSDAQSILQKYGNLLDGLFLFGAAGLPYQLAQCNSNYTLAVHQAGKISMASVTPHYWGFKQYSIGRRYFEFDGGEGLALQWQSIMTNQPDWVEIVTWNDFNESTYSSPVADPGQYFSELVSPRRYCHSGYLELSRRFISWYKNGQQPGIDSDALYYFYRTHPKSAVALNTNDVPVTWFIGNAQDTLYTTVFLVSSAQLEIDSGLTSTTNSLPAGMSTVRTPFIPGPQKLTLSRGGSQVLTVKGPDIQTNIQVYDFFPASGFAYGKPIPPTNVRATGP
ncbi:MAG TPA: endo-1,3-alpha-glucanase family glycosylhydrolase [Candidatus Acidoferrum sp.]|jgi:glucan endo-1,3-alpha-glucosidase|nr:endo-1,3-alpha-glucanase family glycosylhydrolase [Candidatus Acidoferrum sp.]